MSKNSDETELLIQQRKRIEFLRAQNKHLDFELRQDRKEQAILKEPLLNNDIKNYKADIEKYLRRNRQEELLIKETAQTIRTLSTRLQAQQRSRGGEHVTRYNNSLLSKQANILQQRLDVGMVKYNKILETNTKLREQIDRLIQQRETFDKIFSRIGAEVTLVSDETTRLNQQIALMEHERDAVAQEMDRMMEDAAQTAEEFDKKLSEDDEMRKLQRQQLAREKARLEPISTAIAEPDDETKDGGEEQASTPKVGVMTPEEETSLLTSQTIGKWTTVAKKKVIEQNKLDLAEIQKFFEKLYDATGISDADELSKTFLESERRIFSVFRDINAVTEDIDALQQEVSALEAAQSRHNPNRQQNLLHRRAVLKTKQTLKRADEYEAKYEMTRKELGILETHIVELRNALVAAGPHDHVESVSANTRNAGPAQATTESFTDSIMQNLGQIEQHIREVTHTEGPLSPNAKTTFSRETMKASRKKIAEVEKSLKKKLMHDSIFRDDFSDSDDGNDDYAGAGGLLPHSEMKTKRLVRRHFALQKHGGGGNAPDRRAGTRRR